MTNKSGVTSSVPVCAGNRIWMCLRSLCSGMKPNLSLGVPREGAAVVGFQNPNG